MPTTRGPGGLEPHHPPSIRIGTSGWHYDHWRGPFYPMALPKTRFLDYYRGRFDTVEINNTFYRLPEAKTLIEWRNAVPPGFVFAVKASRFITHVKRLRVARRPVALFLERVERLGDKLGPILFQLPPRWYARPNRLDSFLRVLPLGHRYAFEFRDPSWFQPRVYEALARHGAAFCIYDLAGRTSPTIVTTAFAYVRLHGPAGPYQGTYASGVLASWARAIRAWVAEGRDVYCYFDNDQAGYAARDAARLRRMLARGRRGPAPTRRKALPQRARTRGRRGRRSAGGIP